MLEKEFEFIDEEQAVNKVRLIRACHEQMGGKALTSDRELALLFELARGFGHSDITEGYCLESGTFYGLSALCMAYGVKESRMMQSPVFTIDAYQPYRLVLEDHELMLNQRDKIDDYETNLPKPITARNTAIKLELENHLCQVIYDSNFFLHDIGLLIRFAFLDSSHEVATLTNEILQIRKNLVKGGCIAFHNYEMEAVLSTIDRCYGKEKDRFVCEKMCVVYEGA